MKRKRQSKHGLEGVLLMNAFGDALRLPISPSSLPLRFDFSSPTSGFFPLIFIENSSHPIGIPNKSTFHIFIGKSISVDFLFKEVMISWQLKLIFLSRKKKLFFIRNHINFKMAGNHVNDQMAGKSW